MSIGLLFALLGSMAGVPAAAQASPRDHVEAMRHLRLGQAEMREERWAKAEVEFKGAVKLEPSLEMAHYGLGQVYMATKRYPAAVAAYLACRDAWAANISARASNDLSAQRQLDDQIQALEDERTLLASGRVTAMLSAGPADLDRRIADLRARRFHDDQGVPQTPTWISVALGGAYFRTGALADAEREYRMALKVDSRLGEAHNNLAVICMMTGRYAEAQLEVAAAEKSGVRVNPQFKEDLKRSQTAR
jgi:Flp pilus assembly protein TadD